MDDMIVDILIAQNHYLVAKQNVIEGLLLGNQEIVDEATRKARKIGAYLKHLDELLGEHREKRKREGK